MSSSVSETTRASVDETKLCLHYAKKVLRKKAYTKAQPFLEEWERSIPVGLEVKPEMLRGLALLDGSGGLAYFGDLPRDPKARFAALFGHQSRWKAQDLKPFLAGVVVPPGKQVENILEEHLHIYRKDEVDMYVLKPNLDLH